MTQNDSNILAAREAMENGDAWLSRWESHSWSDYERFWGACIRDPRQRDRFMQIGILAVKDGIPLPAAIPGLREQLRSAFRASHETDPLSAEASIVVPGEGRHVLSWEIFEKDPLTANLTEGKFARISGPPRGGKTTLGCVMIERWIEKGNIALSNIDMEVPNHIYVPRVSDFLRAAIDVAGKRKRWTLWLDEARAIGQVKSDWMYQRSRQLNRLLPQIGKLRGNMVLIEHLPEAVPTLIQAWATSLFYCHEPKHVSIDLRGPELFWRQDVVDFPNTKLPFETHEWASFEIDVDTDDMFSAIAAKDNKRRAILNYLDRPKIVAERKTIPVRDKRTGQIIRWDAERASRSTSRRPTIPSK